MSQQILNIPTLASAGSLPESETVQIRLSLEGDLQAFSDLVRPYRPMFYKKALSIVRNDADAEDVTQTALLKAFKKLSQFRLDSQFRTWVTSIVINEALMYLRASRRAKLESLDREEREDRSSTLDIADPRENPSHVVERKQLRAAILKAVSLLPSLLRKVFILRDLRLLSISDTARTLGITETCVKTRLRRARLQLQQTLAHFRGAHQTVKRDYKSNSSTNSIPWSWSSKLASEIEMEAIH
jgi:RNA polymerase sigma-70 factor (ECF subfamily)